MRRIIGRRLGERADRIEQSAHETADVAQQQMIKFRAEAVRVLKDLVDEIEDGVSVGVRRTTKDYTPLDFLRGKCDVAPFELFIKPASKESDNEQ